MKILENYLINKLDTVGIRVCGQSWAESAHKGTMHSVMKFEEASTMKMAIQDSKRQRCGGPLNIEESGIYAQICNAESTNFTHFIVYSHSKALLFSAMSFGNLL